MKNNIAITTILLFVCQLAFGQTAHIRYTEGYASRETSIIRNWMGCSLRYYPGGDHGFIALAGHDSTTVVKIPLEPGRTVEDMCVLNNELFFCGSYQHSAFIGKIDLYSLMAGNPLQGIIYKAFSEEVYSLHRMVVFNDNDFAHVVALGNSAASPTFANQLIIECNLQNNLNGNVDLMFPSHTNSREIVDEIIHTDNYVAFVGQLIDSDGVVIHPCPRSSNVLASFGQCSYYPYPDDATISPFIGTCLSADSIAVVACLGSRSNNTTEIRLHTFDLACMAMLSHQSVAIGGEKLIPQELLYYPEQESLILLTPYPFDSPTNTFSTFFNLHPFSYSSYNTPGMYNPRIRYQSIDKTFTNSFYASGGNKWFLYLLALTFVPADCYRVVEVDVALKSLIDPTPLLHIHRSQTIPTNTVAGLYTIENNTLSIECFQN